MTSEAFDQFFRTYAGRVEGFYDAAYWRLSDELIRELIRRHLAVQPGDHVMDAGGGTGRWALWCADELGLEMTVADKSPQMLAEAARLAAASDTGRMHLVECDLEDAPELASDTFDGVISTYGVLSFLSDPAAAFATLHRVMRPGAHGLLMGHSFANAVHSKINRDGAGPDELRSLMRDQVVRWAPHVPPLRVYSSATLRRLAENAGFECVRVYGVTTLAAPGPEDFTYPYERMSPLSTALTDPDYFATLLELELEASEHPEWADRGVNLMVHIRKAGQ